MCAFSSNRAIGVAAPRGKIVRAHHHSAPMDLAPSADVVGGRETRDSPLFVIVGKAGQAPDFPEAAGVEPQIDALTAGQFAALALAYDTGVIGVRSKSAQRNLLQGAHVRQHRPPGINAMAAL